MKESSFSSGSGSFMIVILGSKKSRIRLIGVEILVHKGYCRSVLGLISRLLKVNFERLLKVIFERLLKVIFGRLLKVIC